MFAHMSLSKTKHKSIKLNVESEWIIAYAHADHRYLSDNKNWMVLAELEKLHIVKNTEG